MAITINNTSLSDKLVASLEPITFRVTGSEYVTQAPAVEFFGIIFNTMPSAGDSMAWQTGTALGTINFITSGPRAVGVECIEQQSGQTRKQWIENNLIPVLREIPGLDNYDFQVSGGSDQLRISSIESIEDSLAFTHTGYTTTHSTSDGSAGVFKENYKIKAQVQMSAIQISTTFPLRSPWIYFTPRVISGNGVVEEDIHEIIHSMFIGEDVPAETGGGLFILEKSVRQVLVKFAEDFESDAVNYNRSTAICQVIRGGRKLVDQTDDLNNWSSSRFFTNRNNISVDRQQSDWLYFRLPSKGLTEKLYYRVRILSVSGTETVVNHTEIVVSQVAGTFYGIPAGYDQLALDPYEQNPLWYEIDIVRTDAADTVLSVSVDPIRFYVQETSDYISGIQYFNAFGFLESMLLDGSSVIKTQFDRELQRIEKKIGAGIQDHQEIGYAIEASKTIECTTGPISKSGWLAAHDLLLSKKLYWINILDNNRRYAVQLDKGSTELSSFSEDGTGFSQIPLKLRMISELTNSNDYKITDAV